MDALAILRRLHQHRQCVNEKLVVAAERLDDGQLHRSFEIGQGSIWRSLTHLYAGEYVWLAALQGDESPLTPGDVTGKLPGNQEGDGAMSSLAELRSRWSELDDRWQAYLDGLQPDDLTDTVYKTNSLTGQRAAARRCDILLHVCTHAHYTVAQIMNMLRHSEVSDLPDPMMITLARQEAVTQS